MTDTIIHIWQQFLSLTDFIPIDLILVLAIAFMFGRFVWVMQRRTRAWDNLSRSLMAVFISISMVFLYLGVVWVTDPFPGQEALLWLIRVLVLVSITWSQFELNKELKKVPNILFIRDRNWVRRRIKNVETIRSLLISHSTTPPDLIEAIDNELEEMYRFKKVVWDEDRKHGYREDPDWTNNPYYVEKNTELSEIVTGGPAPATGHANPNEGGTS